MTRTRTALATPVVALLACAGAFIGSGSGTALAPEPARLTASLATGTGATAAAVYVNTAQPTSVVNWGTSPSYAPNGPAAGTPCSPGALGSGVATTRVIQRLPGNYVRCV